MHSFVVPFFPRPGQSLFEQVLTSKTAPDVVARLWDEGLVPSLEALEKGVPLWLGDHSYGSSPWADVAAFPQEPELGWDWGGSLGALPEPRVERSEKEMLWLEHVLVRMVRIGLDPDLLIVDPVNRRDNQAPSLVEWAHARGFPFLLQECLSVLSPERRRALLQPMGWGSDSMLKDRIHNAVEQGVPLLAQVWKNAGANPAATDGLQRTALFYPTNLASLKWALAQGLSLEDKDVKGKLPFEAWEERVTVGGVEKDNWVQMQDHASSVQGSMAPHYEVLVEKACREIREDPLKEIWAVHPVADVLPSGRTPLGVTCRAVLQTPSKNEHWVMRNANKVLNFLLKKTDLSTAFSTVNNGVSDAEVLAIVFDRYGHSMKLAGNTMERELGRLGKTGLPVADVATALRWCVAERFDEAAQAKVLEWATNTALGAFGERSSPRSVEQRKASVDFAQEWSGWIEQRLAQMNASAKTIGGGLRLRGAPAKALVEMGCRQLAETDRLPGSDQAWARAVFAAVEVLLENGASLERDEDCLKATEHYEVKGHGDNDALAAAFGVLMALASRPKLSESKAFWGRFVELASTQENHAAIRAWVRSHGLEEVLPPPSPSAGLKPRF